VYSICSRWVQVSAIRALPLGVYTDVAAA